MTVKQFLRAHVYRVAGHSVEFALIHTLYRAACDTPNDLFHRVKFSRALHAAGYSTGVTNSNRVRIINATVNPAAKPSKPLTLRKAKATSRKRITK